MAHSMQMKLITTRKGLPHLEAAGFRLLRFWNSDVPNRTDAVMEAIWGALNPSPPQPSTSPAALEGEGAETPRHIRTPYNFIQQGKATNLLHHLISIPV